MALVPTAVEFFKNLSDFRFFDSGAAIRDTHDHEAVFFLCAERDRLFFRSIAVRVVDQVEKHFLRHWQIDEDLQSRVFHVEQYRSSVHQTLSSSERCRYQFSDRMRHPLELEL